MSKIASKTAGALPEQDPSTLSNYYKNFKSTETDLSIYVDWKNQRLQGRVIHHLQTSTSPATIVLDSSFLDISAVKVNDEPAEFELSPRAEPLGAALSIKNSASSSNVKVEIDFATTEKCTALQWLTPEQTAGKKAPYLFSQCQAIHARSLFPCFDTPSIKSKYNFTIKSLYPSLASGNAAGEGETTPEPLAAGEGSEQVFRYVQHIPIPSYLVAIASGDLESASIGPRSKVYSEPKNVKACQYEFEADTENIIQAAEKVVFPYEWKTYNVLVLPPSFPYGGMENPNITFATPTLISGDRQNVNVIAHELAHSWSGNLVTNCSWEHFWLNEGWTVYLERRILGALNGEQFRQFHAIIGWQELEHAIEVQKTAGAYEFTRLVVDLQDAKDPDDAFSTVPYEKGFNFLYYLETILGKEVWDPFIPYYFGKFKGQSLDSYQFRETLYTYFKDHTAILDKIDWDTWYFAPGMPPVTPQFDTSLADACYHLAGKWVAAAKSGKSKSELVSEFSAKDIEGWTSTQQFVFIDRLSTGFQEIADTKEATQALDEIFAFASSSNPEVISRWYRLAVAAKLESQYEPLAAWLGTVGRMKFVRPGFRDLNKVARPLALERFEQLRDFYHPICRAMVVKDLGL